MNSRTIKLHEESVGAIQDGLQPTIVAEVTYWKGRGYQLAARAQQNHADGAMSFMPVTGIMHRKMLLLAKRFSKAKLAKVAKESGPALAVALDTIRAELVRRIQVGESY